MVGLLAVDPLISPVLLDIFLLLVLVICHRSRIFSAGDFGNYLGQEVIQSSGKIYLKKVNNDF